MSMHEEKPLKAKCALVTGASSRSGLAIARTLAREGASVFLVSSEETALREAATEIRDTGGTANYHACDVTQVPALYDMLDVYLATFHRLDILVNCCSIGFHAPLMGTRRADIGTAIDLNLKVPILLTQAALPALLKSAPSDIVNVGLLSAKQTAAEATIECGTHAGLLGFSRSLALELEPANIRVTMLCLAPTGPPYFERYATAAADALLDPEEGARVLAQALVAPTKIQQGEILIYPR